MPGIADLTSELQALTANQLRARYLATFGESTAARNKPWLIRRILWRVQAVTDGGLSDRAVRRARELAREGDLRLSPPRIDVSPHLPEQTEPVVPQLGMPALRRMYKGQSIEVQVLPEGFEYDGQRFRSLSAVAKAITGSHCSGNLFFGLSQRRTPK